MIGETNHPFEPRLQQVVGHASCKELDSRPKSNSSEAAFRAQGKKEESLRHVRWVGAGRERMRSRSLGDFGGNEYC